MPYLLQDSVCGSAALCTLGIQEGKCPALVRDIGRLTALLPSYEMVQQELAERGLNLNIKEVHGIGQYAGQAALAYRRRELELYREGKLPAANGRGKRFGAMIDGGRTKIRKMKRKKKATGKPKHRNAASRRIGASRSKSLCLRWTSKAA